MIALAHKDSLLRLTMTERAAVICAWSEEVPLKSVIRWEWSIKRTVKLKLLTRRIISAQPRHLRCNLIFWQNTGGLPLSLFDLESRIIDAAVPSILKMLAFCRTEQ